MPSQRCDALVVHCMDYRLQKHLRLWIAKRFGLGNFDLISIAGGVLDHALVLKYVRLAVRLHKIKTVCLINHEDCGAYGRVSTDARHAADLKRTRRKIEQQFPNVKVEAFYLRLNGRFQAVH